MSTGVAWMDGRSDDVHKPAAGAGEGRGGGTVRGLQGARVQAGRADMQADGPNRAEIAFWLVVFQRRWLQSELAVWPTSVKCWLN